MEQYLRFKKLIARLKDAGIIESQKDLCKKIGYNEAYLSQIINGKEDISDKFKEKLKSLDDRINILWLESGEGEILTSDTENAICPATCTGQDSGCDEENSTLCGEVICGNRLPYVKTEIVQDNDLSIKKLVLQKSHKLIQKTLLELIGNNVDYTQRVITSAMAPLFQPGDLLFVRFLPDNATPISGAIYLLDTKKHGAMVRQVYLQDGKYILHPINPDYLEIQLLPEDIFSIGLVVRSLRSDFNMPPGESDLRTTIQNKDKQMEQVLESNAQLINEMIKQNERMGKIVDKLVNCKIDEKTL